MKTIFRFAMVTLALLGLTACRQEVATGKNHVKVGVIQYAEHPALDAAQKGFIKALNEAGYKEGQNLQLTRKNAQGEQANLQTMVDQLAGKNDLNFAIATPAAQAMVNADQETPTIFTAVTDPISAGLVKSLAKPGGTVTGTLDAGDVSQQIEVLTKAIPKAKKVGIFYNSSEVNSQIQAKAAKKALLKKGLDVVIKTVTSSNDVQQVMTSLAAQVDAVYLPTDNTVASTATTIGEILKEAKVPAIGSDAAYLDAVLLTSGVDYQAIGHAAGAQALKILKGKKVSELPVQKPQKPQVKINEAMAKVLGIDTSTLKAALN
ncbi:ABC transporter substrate-binding protein [Streptococcus porcinus]|uniref:ABC transporter substrate-binding protein n=1 Tax=Streptococcus porcinus TaxID=1340 RepID=UPI00196001F2|nr:ABC transporter substrate-binding protein [Streptococcus porcinus]